MVPPCGDKRRRRRLEKDDAKWLHWYFGADCSNPFWYDFTSQQLEMIAAIAAAVRYGGDQAIAASRGEGKTTLAERLVLKYALQGTVDFSVLFGATGTGAENSLESIKADIADNDRLCADYPEVCVPVRALENTPNRAHYQIVTGKRHDNGKPYVRHPSKFSWCGHEVVLPNVPGSPSAGYIIATRGLDAAVRGLKKRGKRPKLAVIDDPDTEDTARSEDQAKKLEDRIDKGIGGLGSQQRPIGRVMITTLQSRTSASYRFTDPQQKPTWKGKRFRYLIEPPTRLDLWQEYVAQRQADLATDDEFGRRSHQMYADNREQMDAGAEVANPHRFDQSILPDGTQAELSALQRYFNEVARIGAEAVATEYDNDPPEETGPVESGINPSIIQRQLSGLDRGRYPDGCVAITQGVDVGKWRLHWVVKAWRSDATGYVIDYGRQDVVGAQYGTDEGLDRAIHAALLRRAEEFAAAGYCSMGGEQIRDPLTLVDASYRTDAVYAATQQIGQGWMPVMGFGKSAGCTQANFYDIQRRTQDKKPGDGWFLSRKGRLWLVCADADRWKAWEHDRWMTAKDKPGCAFLWGEPSNDGMLSVDEKAHFEFAQHICAEIEVEEVHKGTIRRRWKPKAKENHWLDASYYADVAASIKRVRLPMRQATRITAAIPSAATNSPRKSLAEMASAARGR